MNVLPNGTSVILTSIELAINDLIAKGWCTPNYSIFISTVHPDSIGSYGPEVYQSFERGDRGNWLADYEKIALSKALLSWEHKKATSQIPIDQRNSGDTKYFGSVYDDEIVVAVSGFKPEFDEMVANWILSALLALRKLERIEHFIPKPEIPADV